MYKRVKILTFDLQSLLLSFAPINTFIKCCLIIYVVGGNTVKENCVKCHFTHVVHISDENGVKTIHTVLNAVDMSK